MRHGARTWATLAGLTLLAAALRLWGLEYGLPQTIARPDEELIVGKALQISVGRIRDPGVFDYSHLTYYVDALALSGFRGLGRLLGVYASTDDFLVDVAFRRPGIHYLVCRSVATVFGAATVLVTAFAAWHGYRRRAVGLAAALLVAVNYLHARDSHFATVDVPMTFFVTLSLAFALRAAGTQARRDFLLAGLFAGLATSAKYNAGVVILCAIVAALPRLVSSDEPRARRSAVVSLALAGLLMAAAFAATSPYCVVHLGDVLTGLVVQRRLLFGGGGGPAWRIHLATTLPGAFGWPGFAAVVLGVAHAAWRRRPADLVLLALVVPTFASMAGMTWVFPRYTLPMIPALAILAAEAALAVVPPARTAWAVVVSVVLALPALRSIVAYDRLAAREDTRVLAAGWVAENLPPRSRILVCRGYGAPVINDDHRRPPAFKPHLVPCSIDDVRSTEARYLITHEHPYVRFSALRGEVKEWLATDARLLAVFDPFRAGARVTPFFYRDDAFYLPWSGFGAVDRGGPILRIWELPAPRP